MYAINGFNAAYTGNYSMPMNGAQGGGFTYGGFFGMFGGFARSSLGYNSPCPGYSGLSMSGATGAFLGQPSGFGGGAVAQFYHQQALFEQYTDCQKNVKNKKGKTWDVWFDHKNGQKTKRLSPIVLDLNGDGKAGITGKNIKGDGKISGRSVKFDIDPSRDSWSHKSKERRPGSGAPDVKGGHWKDGKYLDKRGEVVGEKRNGFYYWGNRERKEKTEWLKKNGGDGLLVWDKNKDGKITSSKELFGNFDIHGRKRFKNGYDKLSHYFDKNDDGQVNGKELRGLKVWKDRDADGKVDRGEMKSVQSHHINNLNTDFKKKNMSSDFNRRKVSYQDVQRQRLVGWQSSLLNIFAGWQGQPWGGCCCW